MIAITRNDTANVRKKRAELRLTQDQLAGKINIARSTLCKIERDNVSIVQDRVYEAMMNFIKGDAKKRLWI